MNPYIGMPVLYRLRPGQARCGQNELAAMITKINPSRERKIEVPQEFKRTVKQRDGEGKEVSREVTETRMIEGAEMAPASVDLVAFVPDSEAIRVQNVPVFSDGVRSHCWLPNEAPPPVGKVEVHLEERQLAELRKAQSDIASLSEQIKELAEIVTAPVATDGDKEPAPLAQ